MKKFYETLQKKVKHSVQEKSTNVDNLIKNTHKKFYDMETEVNIKENMNEIETFLLKEPLSLNERIQVVFNALYLNSNKMLAVEKLERLLFLSGRVQPSLHILALGNPAIGKTTSLIRNNPKAERISPEVTEATLIYNAKSKEEGFISTKNMLVCDDIHETPLVKIKSFLMDYLETGNIVRSQEQKMKTSDTNIYFLGNMTEDLQKELSENPYHISPKNIWECPKDDMFQQTGLQSRLFPIIFSLGRDDCFKLEENTMGMALGLLNPLFDKFRNNHLCKVLISKASKNSRKNAITYRVTEGILKLLCFSLEEINPFLIHSIQQLVEAYTIFGETGKLKLIGTQELDYFWIVASANFFPYPVSSIKQAWVDWDRIMVRFSENPDIIYKIATTKIGIEKNKTEVELYAKASAYCKEHLVKIENYGNENIIVQSFVSDSPYGNRREFDISILHKLFISRHHAEEDYSHNTDHCKCYPEIKKIEQEIKKIKLKLNQEFQKFFSTSNQSEPYNIFWTENDFSHKKNRLKEKLSALFNIPIDNIRDYDIVIPCIEKDTFDVKFLNYDSIEYVSQTSTEMIHELNKKLKR